MPDKVQKVTVTKCRTNQPRQSKRLPTKLGRYYFVRTKPGKPRFQRQITLQQQLTRCHPNRQLTLLVHLQTRRRFLKLWTLCSIRWTKMVDVARLLTKSYLLVSEALSISEEGVQFRLRRLCEQYPSSQLPVDLPEFSWYEDRYGLNILLKRL